MTLDVGEKIVRYLLSKLGCIHPFRISRLVLLVEWSYKDKYGSNLSTGFTYIAESFGFYVDELPKVMDKLSKVGCVVKDENNKCFLYKCDVPKLDENISKIVDDVVDKFTSLSDKELNDIIVNDKRYRMLLKR